MDFLTERQRQVYQASLDHPTKDAAARSIGMDTSNFRKSLSAVNFRIAQKEQGGFKAPEHQFIAKQTVQVDASGEVERRWLKLDEDKTAQLKHFQDYIENLTASVPARSKISAPKLNAPDLLNQYTITDYHIGQLSWHKEGGADWDIKIAADTLRATYFDMIKRSPKADNALVCQLGDFLHYDSMQPLTPTSGHIVDSDSRPAKMIECAMDMMDFMISEALNNHKTVYCVIAQGNHDLYGSRFLSICMKRLYRNNPRVEFITNELPFYAMPFGDNFLGYHHGHKVKFDRLPELFANEFRELFGCTKRSFIHTGHYHHRHIKELGKTVIEMHRTLSARDAHSSYGGYMSERSTDAITYHKDHGEVGRITAVPVVW